MIEKRHGELKEFIKSDELPVICCRRFCRVLFKGICQLLLFWFVWVLSTAPFRLFTSHAFDSGWISESAFWLVVEM